MLRMALALGLAVAFAAPASAASVGDLSIVSTVQGSGKTIIFVHGWTCDQTSWAAQAAAFDDDYRVVTLDLPGHGKSDSPAQADFSMELFAKAVDAVRAEVGADKVVLVGHSMGAAVIREYALDHPEHVAGLVAVDGPLDMRVFKDFPGFGPVTMEMRTGMINGMFVPTTSPELREQILGTMLGTSEATAAGAMAAMMDPKNQSDAKIMAPALTIWAGNSNFPNTEATREMLPDWAEEKFDGTGHFVMMEQPERFNASLKTFLETRAKF